VNVVDSSGWLEYLADSDRADLFAPAIEDFEQLIVPTISLYEVYKKVLRERGENAAAYVFSLMNLGLVIDLDSSLALEAAQHQLPLADSIIYATALRHGATLWTQDGHFEGIEGVRYFKK
jgi:predicted nucleic acid-binding protein